MQRSGFALVLGLAFVCAVAGGPSSIAVADFDDDDHPARATAADDAQALAIVANPWHVPTDVLRRAILRARDSHSCRSIDGLAAILDDTARDAVTRGMAALVLGEIACHRERVGHGERDAPGLSNAAISSLESATYSDTPAGVRQSATRALGRAGATSASTTLDTLRSDPNPIVRFLAAQALTRVSHHDSFDTAFRDRVVLDVINGASGYQILDEAHP
jgi:hypothetical protein